PDVFFFVGFSALNFGAAASPPDSCSVFETFGSSCFFSSGGSSRGGAGGGGGCFGSSTSICATRGGSFGGSSAGGVRTRYKAVIAPVTNKASAKRPTNASFHIDGRTGATLTFGTRRK